MHIDYFESPIGSIELMATDVALVSLVFESPSQCVRTNTILQRTKQQLNEYFSGIRQTFDVPLAATGTQFQQQVWRQLLEIPFGETRSYRDIALSIKNPKSMRAVGSANSKNPISIIVPCHRVIGSSGTLTGYAGGLERKAWLLEHEAANGFTLSP